MNLLRKSNIKWLVTAIVLLTAIFLFVYRLLPYSDNDIHNSIVDAEHRYNYVIKNGNTPLLYFVDVSSDSSFIGLSIKDVKAVERSLGCWINSSFIVPSCKGRIATVFGRCDSTLLDTGFMNNVIKEQLTSVENNIASLTHARMEMNYYLDTHGYNDQGYKDVVRYRDSLDVERSRLESIAYKLKEANESKDLKIEYKDEYLVYYHNKKQICHYIDTNNKNGNTLIQVTDSITPDSVTALSLWNVVPINMEKFKETVFVYGRTFHNNNDIIDRDIEIIPQEISGDTLTTIPRLNIMQGSPVFTRKGIFLGILAGDTIINRNVINKSL